MKILYYFAETSFYMEAWQRIHIFDELKRHACEVEVFNPLDYETVEQANEMLLKRVYGTVKYDLFMTCHASEWFVDDVILKIRENGLKTLLICFDNFHAPFMHKKIANQFDLVWLTSKETRPIFEKWGARDIIFQTYAANPYVFFPRKAGACNQAVAFVGRPYGSRAQLLNIMGLNNIKVELFCGGERGTELSNSKKSMLSTPPKNTKIKSFMELLSFPIGRLVLLSKAISLIKQSSSIQPSEFLTIKNSVSFNDLQKIYSNYSLSLNSLVLRNTGVLKTPLYKIHLRTFEIPMSGGLEFAQRTDELCSYFEDGKEIVLFDGEEEMIDKARFYLKEQNLSLVQKMKISARERSEKEHTWFNRFEKVFYKLRLKV